VSANVAVGFSPVAQGQGIVNVGGAAAAEAESPLGFLGALIETLVQGVVPAAEAEVSAEAPIDISFGGLTDIGLAVSSEITVPAPEPVLPETTLPPTGEDLLSQLVNALAAPDQAVADGKPVDPALKKKLTETLDALAGMLGIQLPTPPAVDPAIAAAASATGEIQTDLDPLLEIAKAAAPAADVPAPVQPSVPAPAPVPTAGAGGSDVDALIAATASIVAAGEAQAAADAAETPVPATTAPVAEGKAPVDPNSPLGKIVQKLADLAQALSTQSPDLAKKLEVVAQKLTSGEINAEALAKLGASTDLDAATVDALLAPKPESKPAPAPQLFAAPNLTLPSVAVPAPKQVAQPAAPVEETPAPAKAEETPETEPVKIAVDPKPSDKREIGDTQNPKPNSFAAALSESRAGQPETNSQQPAQPAQIKTELGIVVPKAAHAAYQAPVQQVNMPQVAFEVARQFQHGNSRFQIRLDPPELGRIDVHMKVDRDGNVQARMTVERSETLDLMQRDQRSLEKALAQAGLDSSKTNLEFSLRQNPFAREESGNGRGGQGSPFSGGRGDAATGDEAPEIVNTTQYRGSASASGVNLFV
jgi:flagellar hook-length control protein FliK